jgi:hypothetical protein
MVCNDRVGNALGQITGQCQNHAGQLHNKFSVKIAFQKLTLISATGVTLTGKGGKCFLLSLFLLPEKFLATDLKRRK